MITRLSTNHAREIARLHLAYLRTNYRGLPGQRLLELYYKSVAQETGGCGYVCESDSSLRGYVCGIWDATAVRKTLLKQYTGALCGWSLIHQLLSPYTTLQQFRRINSSSPSSENEPGYELRPIVVIPAARGTQVAQSLVETLLMDAGQRGYPVVHLYTEIDNPAANRFYGKMQFTATGTEQRPSGLYHRYERSTSTDQSTV